MTAFRITILAMSALLALSACQRQAEDKPTELSGRLVVFNYRVSHASFLITLRKTAPIPEGTVAIAEFENPMGGDPIVVREMIFPLWDKISLETPGLHCVRKDRPYAVAVRLEDAGGKTIQSMKTEVKSDVDQSAVLAAEPLVVGPFYTENPDIFKDKDKPDFSPEHVCPSA
ncbi:hypothetical protein [Rhizobium sp. RAF56]|jgi:hypothetical protein|uniref:hypothetical protein n=1 Tax=Rhizobium sp. RAF56 TaxID=3233062 RepID=UPI003F993F37